MRVSMLVAVLFAPICVIAQPAPPAPEPAAVEVAKPTVTHAMERASRSSLALPPCGR
jgi:hypothetical protein